MKNFPLELVDAVAGEVSSQADLLSLRAVNNILHTFLTPKAFRRIQIHCDANFVAKAEGLEKLGKCKTLAKLVKEVVLEDQIQPEPFILEWPKAHSSDEDFEQRRKLAAALGRTFSRLHVFPSVEAIYLDFWPTYYEKPPAERIREHPMYFLTRQSAIIHNLLAYDFLSIKSLTLTNLVLLHFQGYTTISTNSLSSLTHLSISVLSNDEQAKVARLPQSMILSFIASPSALFPPALSALTSLTLRSQRGKFYLPDMHLAELRYTHLTSLTLENIVFQHTSLESGWESFITHHRNTLCKLRLHECSVFIDADGNTRHWANVWNTFAEQLEALVNFTTGGKGPGYNAFDTDSELHALCQSVDTKQVEADNDALTAFKAIVEARRVKSSRRR